MSRMIKTLVALAVVAAASVGAVMWYADRADGSSQYRTGPVRRSDIVSSISATGTVVPEDVIDVGAQVNGQIASFGKDKDDKTIDYRSTIDEGAVLAKIDDALYAADLATSKAQLEQAEAQVRLAEANHEQAKAKLDQSSRDWERAQRLGQSAALAAADYDASRSAYEQAVAGLAVAEASIGQARASVAMARASVERSQRNLNYCTITSPVSGVIIDKRVEIGQTVVASLNAPSLFLIAKDLKRMEVLVQVNEADIGSVHQGQAVTFTVDAFPGMAFHGEVRKVRLNATMTQNVVTYTVEITTDNPDLKLLPYLTANVQFMVARRDKVLAVPNAALRWSPKPAAAPATSGRPDAGASRERTGATDQAGGPTVWLLEGGRPRPVSVRTGLSDGTLTEVESPDLLEGAAVIIGEETSRAGASAATSTGASPFAPPMNRGGRPR